MYSVSGTIGQHDAGGPMTGGNYSLTGGFWALYAVQTPGAPCLHHAHDDQHRVRLLAVAFDGMDVATKHQRHRHGELEQRTGTIQDDGTTKTLSSTRHRQPVLPADNALTYATITMKVKRGSLTQTKGNPPQD